MCLSEACQSCIVTNTGIGALYEYVSGVELRKLPCGGCDHCARVDLDLVMRDVDVAILLVSQGV